MALEAVFSADIWALFELEDRSQKTEVRSGLELRQRIHVASG